MNLVSSRPQSFFEFGSFSVPAFHDNAAVFSSLFTEPGEEFRSEDLVREEQDIFSVAGPPYPVSEQGGVKPKMENTSEKLIKSVVEKPIKSMVPPSSSVPTKMTPFVNLGETSHVEPEAEVKPTMLAMEHVETETETEKTLVNHVMTKQELLTMAMHRLNEIEDKMGR